MTGFKMRINDGYLYEGSDGREAWVMLMTGGQVAICTDIHDQGQPYNCVLISAEHLREIADLAERHEQESQR